MLSTIADVPESDNVDCISLEDILCDVGINKRLLFHV